jgi:glycosyltransferase involved in cell wall biosynthesis
VCIDARATPEAGGVLQALIGLAGGLSRLSDGDEEYAYLVYADDQDWLRPYVPSARSLVPMPKPSPSSGRKLLRALVRRSGVLGRLVATRAGRLSPTVPRVDGAFEGTRAEVVHLAMPFGFRTELPTVYQVYDLQHLHYPEFFNQATILRREVTYRALCEQARAVTVPTEFGRRDLIAQYGLPEGKVHVVGMASVLELYPAPTAKTAEALRQRLDLPERFAFYPANTWPHKNHLALLDALVELRDRGLTVPLVCSGAKTDFFPAIGARVEELGLERSVRFLDYVEPAELRCLYELCRCVVFPTKFEGWGMPLTEAFAAGRPAACSAIPPLLEQTDEAARMFDPSEPEQIAQAVADVWDNEQTREDLIARGLRRAEDFSWETIARTFRALYRVVGGRALSAEDRRLLPGRT